jgi:inner membrane protein
VASLGHLAVGLAATRIAGTERRIRSQWWKAAALWSALSMLPDADVIGFGLGVEYGDEWGHRGATHSLAFSIVLGAIIGAAAPLLRLPALRTGTLSALVVASHAILDTLTNGGLGCALFWPFDLTRYFAPWNPIPVAPIGLAFLSPYGFAVAAVEMLLFAPLFWYGLSRPRAGTERSAPRRWRAGLLWAAWLAAGWLLTSGDPVRERLVSAALRDDTQFAPGFSEAALAAVEDSDTAAAVRDRIGAPLYEFLLYGDSRPCSVVRVEQDMVTLAQPAGACGERGIHANTPRAAVLEALGPPPDTCWAYSRPGRGGLYRLRGVCFAQDRVAAVVRRWNRE